MGRENWVIRYAPADFHGAKVPLKIKPLSVMQAIACTLSGAYTEWLETHTKLAWFRKVQLVVSEEPKRICLQHYFRCKIKCNQAQEVTIQYGDRI